VRGARRQQLREGSAHRPVAQQADG